MKDKKTTYQFKPFDSLEWNDVSVKDMETALDNKQIELLNQNKFYNTGIGAFKKD